MGVTGTSLVTPNDPFYDKANVLRVWGGGALRNAYIHVQVSPRGAQLHAPLLAFTIPLLSPSTY